MKILYVTQFSPYPPLTGGAQRTNLVHRALCALGEVDLVVVTPDKITNQEELREHVNLVADYQWVRPGDLLPFRWFLRFKPDFVHKVARALIPRAFHYVPDRIIAGHMERLIRERQYDVVVGYQLRPTSKSGVLGHGSPVVLDVDDLDTQVFLSRLNLPGRPWWERAINRWHYRQVKRLLPDKLKAFDMLWVSNPDEDNSGQELREFTEKIYLPNIPFQVADEPINPDTPPPPETASDANPVLLFVGNFWALPNKMGVDHFVRKIWPLIRAKLPAAVFRIVGAGLSDDLQRRWASVPGVEAIGFVSELRDSYRDCHVAVVPIYSGGGTNIKVMEAFRFGRTCVLTHFAHRGYGATLRHGESLLVADTDEAFAAACIELLQDPARRLALAERGRREVAKHHSFEKFTSTIAGAIHKLLADRQVTATDGVGSHPQ